MLNATSLFTMSLLKRTLCILSVILAIVSCEEQHRTIRTVQPRLLR